MRDYYFTFSSLPSILMVWSFMFLNSSTSKTRSLVHLHGNNFSLWSVVVGLAIFSIRLSEYFLLMYFLGSALLVEALHSRSIQKTALENLFRRSLNLLYGTRSLKNSTPGNALRDKHLRQNHLRKDLHT